MSADPSASYSITVRLEVPAGGTSVSQTQHHRRRDRRLGRPRPRQHRAGGRPSRGQHPRILVEAAPAHIDVEHVGRDLEQLDDVVKSDDLHVWTITSGMDAMSVHLEVRQGSDMYDVLNRARPAPRPPPHHPRDNPGRTLRPQGLQRRTVVSARYLQARMP
jgi:hypothetical protein